jgi:hypothetical protein
MPSEDSHQPTNPADLVAAMALCVPDTAAASTVAVVGAKALSVRQLGTGTLLAVADAHFVVTAAHVLRQALSHGMTLGVSSGDKQNFTATTSDWMLTTSSEGHASDDKFDVAVYRLSAPELQRFVGVSFIRIADVSFERDLASGYFVVCGHPGIWSTTPGASETLMKSGLLQYGTYAFSGSTSALDGYHPEQHFLLEATRSTMLDPTGKPVVFRTRSGHHANMPNDLAGVSGSSVWMIGDLRLAVGTWAKNNARIVGIQTGVYPSRGAIKFTRWSAVTTLIHSAFPDLRSTIAMYSRMWA